jgi:hypothetical protein
LAALAAGVARATVFELDDTCVPPASACNTQFATAGLLAMSGNPKPAWYYLATFRARLSSYAYLGTVQGTKANVNVAQFADTRGSGGAFVVWMGTSNASVTTGYALSLPAGTSTAKAVTLTDGQATGVETTLAPSAAAVTLDVSETPTIVLYSP